MNIDLKSFLKIHGNELTSDSIVFLLGAGASIDAGIPALGKITDDLETYIDWLSKVKKDPGIKNLYTYFKNESYSTTYSLNSSPNIENILALINDLLSARSQRRIYNLIGSWDKELMEITKGDITKIRELKTLIDDFFLNLLAWRRYDTAKGSFVSRKDYDLRYVYFIFYLQKQLSGNLRIFSLNHDMVIEKAFEEMNNDKLLDKSVNNGYKIKLELGHREEKGQKFFDPNTFTNFRKQKEEKAKEKKLKKKKPDKGSTSEGICQLFKIHGSIDWEEDTKNDLDEGNVNKTIRIKKIEDIGNPREEGSTWNPAIIFGISQKFKSENPYSTLYQKFTESIEDEDVAFLIVVGYSFNDGHINNAIARALQNNKKLHIIITDPHLCETCYYSYPTAGGKKSNDFLKSIIESRDYESYLNMSFMLHSVYYSRNFEEDALFLAYSSQLNNKKKPLLQGDKNPLSLTPSGKSEEKLNKSVKLLNSILSLDDFNSNAKKDIYIAFKKSFLEREYNSNPSSRNEKLNELLNPMSTGRAGYVTTTHLINETKIILYNASNSDKHLLGSEKKKAIKEMLDEIRTIEQFVKRYIPIHLALLFAHIEELDIAKNEKNKSREINIQISIFEMFLKFNYLIDTLVVKLAEEGKDTSLLCSDKEKLLEPDYVKAYLDILNDLEIGAKIKKLNKYLYDVRNGLLQTSLDGDSEYLEEIKELKFEHYFLTFDKEIPLEKKASQLSFVKSVLHPLEDAEYKMKLRVKLYSKAIMKSMISRFQHSNRLKIDYNKLVSQLTSAKLSKDQGQTLPGFSGKEFINEKMMDQGFFLPELFNPEEITEMKIKLGTNLNWYTQRYGRIMKEFIDQSFVLRFDDPYGDYTKNLLVYLRLLNKNSKNCGIYKELDEKGYKYFLKDLRRVNESTKMILNENRISIRHFTAKIFFSKDLRPTNLFKFYHSHFYQDEYLLNFGNVEKLIDGE